MSSITIEKATIEDMDKVYQLVHDEYVLQNYIKPHSDGRYRYFTHLDNIPNTTVLVAKIHGEIVGTNSWKLDGEEKLHTDIDFPEETEKIRQEGNVLGASWRIIVNNHYRSNNRIVFLLIKNTVQQMINAGIKTALFTFDKKHEHNYSHILNMKKVAQKSGAKDLKVAVSILMRLDYDDVPKKWLINDLR